VVFFCGGVREMWWDICIIKLIACVKVWGDYTHDGLIYLMMMLIKVSG
jgi:hypothetical protein